MEVALALRGPDDLDGGKEPSDLSLRGFQQIHCRFCCSTLRHLQNLADIGRSKQASRSIDIRRD